MFWIFDVSPHIAAITGPRPKVVWTADFADSSLALIDASDRFPWIRQTLGDFKAGPRFLLCAGYRGDIREVLGEYRDYTAARNASVAWADYLQAGGTVAQWKVDSAAQRASEIY
jgi:hypothetical protein